MAQEVVGCTLLLDGPFEALVLPVTMLLDDVACGKFFMHVVSLSATH